MPAQTPVASTSKLPTAPVPLPGVAIGNSAVAGVNSPHSAWNPYAILPPTTKRRIDPQNTIPSRAYTTELEVPQDVVSDRIANKYLQLDPPEGKMSDWRKKELETRDKEKEKRRKRKRASEDGCGLIGRRKQASLGKETLARVNYDALVPMHHLWLSYMAELLQLAIVPRKSGTTESTVTVETTTAMYPTFPPRHESLGSALEPAINVQSAHAKLVKAEFVGASIRVKRAKNTALVNLEGIVLQETQSTFKIVTAKSALKVLPKTGSIFQLTLPLKPLSSKPDVERSITFDIHGDAFAFRSAERVGRKWKAGMSAGGLDLV